jgi:hypothetical protein
MGDAKLAAIDVRLILGDHAQDVPGSRIQRVIKSVADYYKREASKKGVALIFLDVGTPKTVEPLAFLEGATVEDETGGEALGVEDDIAPDDEDAAALASTDDSSDSGFNLYEAIKRLIARGVKPHRLPSSLGQGAPGGWRLSGGAGRHDPCLAGVDRYGALGMNIQDRLGLIVEADAPRASAPVTSASGSGAGCARATATTFLRCSARSRRARPTSGFTTCSARSRA